MQNLYKNLEQHNLIENDMIVLARYENGCTQAVDKETFESFFGDTDGTYEGLTTDTDCERMGYKTFFDEWKEKGII